MYDRVVAIASHLRSISPASIDCALVLGTGLNRLPDGADIERSIPYHELPDFPQSTAPGHAGELVFAHWHGRRIAVMMGRFHLYEGWAPADIALPVYVLRELGARLLIVSNAAGALNPDLDPGDAMMIVDHLNFTGCTPLAGVNDERLGVRFPDLSDAYDRHLRDAALTLAAERQIDLKQGIYAAVAGPELETSAERRWLRASGADAVGMSTVIEVIAANHCGLPVTAFSAITNKATGGSDQQPDTIEAVIENATLAAQRIEPVIDALVERMPVNS